MWIDKAFTDFFFLRPVDFLRDHLHEVAKRSYTITNHFSSVTDWDTSCSVKTLTSVVCHQRVRIFRAVQALASVLIDIVWYCNDVPSVLGVERREYESSLNSF